jgi:hypothetical protein
MTTAEFFKRTLIVLCVALVPVLIWFLFDVILITVGAILIAVLLHLVSAPFTRWGKLPQSFALILSGILIIGIVGSAGYLFGTQIEAEMADVVDRANTAATQIVTLLQQSPTGKMILAHIQGGDGFSIPAFLSGIFAVSVSFLEALVVTVIGGFYLAAQPQLYRRGLGKLFPRRLREEADETIVDIGRGLRLWLIGELIQMVLIGVLVTTGRLAHWAAIAARLGRYRRTRRVCSLSRPRRCVGPRDFGGHHQRRQLRILDGDCLSLDPSIRRKSDCAFDPATADLHSARGDAVGDRDHSVRVRRCVGRFRRPPCGDRLHCHQEALCSR